jgi:hypothetical protein
MICHFFRFNQKNFYWNLVLGVYFILDFWKNSKGNKNPNFKNNIKDRKITFDQNFQNGYLFFSETNVLFPSIKTIPKFKYIFKESKKLFDQNILKGIFFQTKKGSHTKIT